MDNTIFRIGDIPSSIGLVFIKMKNITNGIKWTKEEKEYLIKNYSNTDNYILSKKLKKTIPSILGLSRRLSIFKSNEYISSLRYDNNSITINNTLLERYNSFLKNANELHNSKYDYSKFIYINSSTKSIIICPIHGEFTDTPNHHIGKELRGCTICKHEINNTKSKRFNHFLERANKMHNNKFNYSKFIYIDAKTKGMIICPIHGEFEQMPDKHLAKNSKGCTACWFDIMSDSLKNIERKNKPSITSKLFLKRCIEKFGNKFKYDLTNYNGITKNKIKITCPIHGEFETSPRSHIYNNSTGCFNCGKEKAINLMTKNYDCFLKQSKDIHGNKYIYPKINKNTYINKKSIIKIVCKKHGEFNKKAQKHISGQGCYDCRIEELIKQNILCGGYNEILFKRKPFLKDKKAKLYYLKINDGQYYKIGITTVNVNNRISGLKNDSKKEAKKFEIISTNEYNLYDAFTIEQKILSDFKEFRIFTSWSNELFNKNIFNKIKKHFN